MHISNLVMMLKNININYRFPNFIQLDTMDCGPTCLQIIAKYYKKNINLQFLREKAYITRDGVSFLGICDAAKSIGFNSKAVEITFEELVNEDILPCILHWNSNHFVVCYGVNRKHGQNFDLKISDPIGEKYTLDKLSFLESWAVAKNDKDYRGYAIILSPGPNSVNISNAESKEKIGLLKYCMRYFSSYKWNFIKVALSLILSSIFSLLLPYLTQAMIDQGVSKHDLNFVELILIAQFTIFVTQLFVEYFRNRMVLHINTHISIQIVSEFLAKLMKLPISFFDTKNTGDILQRVEDNDRIRFFLTGSTLTTILSLANFIIFTCILNKYNTSVFLVFLGGNILYIIWILLFLNSRKKLDIKRFKEASSEQSNLFQLVTGMQDIKLNNCEMAQQNKWKKIQVNLFNINLKILHLEQYQQLGSFFFSQTTFLVISFLAAKSVISGEMTLGVLLAISYIIGQLSVPINQLIKFCQDAQNAQISMDRLEEIHEKKDEESAVDNAKEIPSDKTLKFKNVFFSYNGDKRNYILHNISMEIPANKTTAIVGTSGSGKTTLLKLMLGFYSPTEGMVTVGGINIRDISPTAWRKKIGTVLQDGFIFSETIAQNIAPGTDKIDNYKLHQSIKMANIEDFIETLPQKYDTKIGMEGNGISQGQKQRILIARAIYKNPDYVFLDEATNALDSENESIILNNLNCFYEGRTVVIVAHRLTTVQNADKIIVIDQGRIVEEGDHLSLCEKRGFYYRLVKNQLEIGL